jgi:hypothetical protein
MTTTEENKRNRLIKVMILVKKTLLEALRTKNIEYNDTGVKLLKDDIATFKVVLFESNIMII